MYEVRNIDMAVPLKEPSIYVCKECNWKSKLFLSDVVYQLDVCPNCGSKELELKTATTMECLTGQLKEI